MSKRCKLTDIDRLEHIIGAIDELMSLLEGVKADVLSDNRVLLLASAKLYEIIGEATAKLTEQAKAMDSSVEWPEMVGMRNVLVHDYDLIAAYVLIDTTREFLPKLRPKIEAILMRLRQ
ncbi:MAG: HepT-like ribonuclease domain-containing protein [Bacteroidota bacterium]